VEPYVFRAYILVHQRLIKQKQGTIVNSNQINSRYRPPIGILRQSNVQSMQHTPMKTKYNSTPSDYPSIYTLHSTHYRLTTSILRSNRLRKRISTKILLRFLPLLLRAPTLLGSTPIRLWTQQSCITAALTISISQTGNLRC
jgi:hypothetical protein